MVKTLRMAFENAKHASSFEIVVVIGLIVAVIVFIYFVKDGRILAGLVLAALAYLVVKGIYFLVLLLTSGLIIGLAIVFVLLAILMAVF